MIPSPYTGCVYSLNIEFSIFAAAYGYLSTSYTSYGYVHHSCQILYLSYTYFMMSNDLYSVSQNSFVNSYFYSLYWVGGDLAARLHSQGGNLAARSPLEQITHGHSRLGYSSQNHITLVHLFAVTYDYFLIWYFSPFAVTHDYSLHMVLLILAVTYDSSSHMVLLLLALIYDYSSHSLQ